MIVLALLSTSPLSIGREIRSSSITSCDVQRAGRRCPVGRRRVPCDLLLVRPELGAKQVAGHPFGVLAKNLMVNVVEHVKLERIAGPSDRLDPVDHAAADADG